MTTKSRVENSNGCNNCGSINDVTTNGYIVCTKCGTAKDREYVDQIAIFSNEKTSTQHTSIGKNIDFVGALGSHIGYASGYLIGSRGKKLSHKTIQRYQRIIKLHQNRARLEGNATHLRTMIAFTRVFNSLSISVDIKFRSLHLYWKHVNSLKRITNHVLLIALCLLQAVREVEKRAPIRFSEIISAFTNNGHRVTNKNILRLAREFGISLSTTRRKPEDYIERVCYQIRSNKEICNKLVSRSISPGQYETILILLGNKLLEHLSRTERGGVQPYPFAVSIIYLADRAFAKYLKRKPILTQKLLANASRSAEFTIRDHVYRFLGDLYKKNEHILLKCIHNHTKKAPSRKL